MPDPGASTTGPQTTGGRPLLLIISGPSGVGKTTITRAVEKAFCDAVFSVSATTRPRAGGERPGVDYDYLSDEQFDRLIAQDAFLEWASVFGKRYGTLRQWVMDRLAEGRLVILEIDVQGAINTKRTMEALGRGGQCLALFVLPPSEEVLLERLRARRRESEEAIQRRFAEAKREIAVARTAGVYDRFMINHDLNGAVEEVIGWVREQRGTSCGG
ncbi:MAG TPA: guanylate kinase [Phycisphaerales bacterium]|nr:guanylate kinase [Phycisphaerales bacterium]